MAGPKDAEVVVRFMGLYSKLRDWTDDDPSHAIKLAEEDEEFGALCFAVSQTASDLTDAERRERRLFATPVDPQFLEAWRDYEQRYSDIVSSVQ